MKAILSINGFSKMIDVTEPKPTVYIIAPLAPLEYISAKDTVPEVEIKRWAFDYSRRLDEDVLLYKYAGEVE